MLPRMAAPDRLHADFRRIRSPFEGRLVRLRAVEESDLDRIHDLFNDPDVLYFLESVVFPQPVDGTRRWWAEMRTRGEDVSFAVETLAGEMLGAVGLHGAGGAQRSATLGIWIGKPFWGLGYGTDAVRTVCRFAFREMNLRRVDLHVHDTNTRGIRAYQKVGFREEGRLRASHFTDGHPVDVLVMGVLSTELIED
jgi:RimJ/RimL family protein N-acetyltransferase